LIHPCLHGQRRPKDELLEKPLGRLQKSAAPQPDRQQRRAKGKAGGDTAAGSASPAPPPLFVGLHAGPSAEHPVLDAAAVTNEEAWRHGRLLRVGAAAYRVDLNPPLLDRLELHGTPFVGIPLVPAMQAHFTEEEACRWRWLRAAPGAVEFQPIQGATCRRYVPRPEDAGCRLRVECTPGRRLTREEAAGGEESQGVELGEAGAAECGPVALPPSPGASEARHALTRRPTAPPHLRVVTYNILADQYAATDAAKNVIFAHCPPQ
jgi:2',5'-phosphodiesterase